MEEKKEGNAGGSFLKIDTIWSEAELNSGNITVKEEMISDLEPECILSVQENQENGDENNSFVSKMADNDKTKNDCNIINEAVNSMESPGKEHNGQFTRLLFDKVKYFPKKKVTCSHNTKKFKIVKKRLRCGDCKSLVCPECCKIIGTTLLSHLAGSNTTNPGVYICQSCKLAFHSFCSLQAHIRIHKMNTPYVCPDCGLIYNNIYFLIQHLINKCYHVYKIVKYKCKSCPGTLFDHDVFSRHIEVQHVKFIFRCSLCPAAINNLEEFNVHKEDVHKNEQVQCLSYFRCSACSNMVLPKFMFDRHISQHRSSSDSLEIEYKCPCGYSYSFVGAFRGHIQHCHSTGILPPQWSFLKKNLKTQLYLYKLLPNENHPSKSDGLLGVTKNSHPESLIKKSYESKSLVKSNAENEKEKIKSIEILVGGSVVLNSDSKNSKNKSLPLNFKLSDSNTDSSSINDGKLESNDACKPSSVINKISNNLNLTEEQKIEEQSNNLSKVPVIQLETENDAEKKTEKIVENEIEIIDVKSKIQNITENEDKEDNDPEEINSDTNKVHYNHIPCDHLGYVIKAQGSESNKKESQVLESPSETNVDKTPPDFHTITELDDKTGVIITKKVFIKDLAEIESVEELSPIKDIDNQNLIDVSPKFYNNNDKNKSKVGSPHFSCPFCIVLFPKHSSTFQQFKLHVESYHPDAALNIPVKQNENKTSDTLLSLETNDTIEDLENLDKQSKNCSDTSEELNQELVLEKSSENVASSHSISFSKKLLTLRRKGDDDFDDSNEKISSANIKNNEESENEVEKEKDCLESSTIDQDEKENIEKTTKPSRAYNRIKENNPCWTLKLSLPRCDSPNQIKKHKSLEEKVVTDTCLNKSENSKSNDSVENGSVLLEATPKVNDAKSVSPVIDCLKSTKILDREEEKSETSIVSNNIENHTGSNEKTEKNTENDKNQNFENDENSVNNLTFFSTEEEANKRILEVETYKEESIETSRETNWSDISSSAVEEIKIMEENIDLKTEGKEKSMREGEVWSQFYESLMLAEKLKKKKEKKHLSSSEEKKESIVTDYSAKRVVKKPKRYRESSDSDDSEASYLISGSDTEMILPNDLPVDVNLEIDDGNDMKKEKLLKKLQNVDENILNYIFNLINQKGKCYELYEKHSSLRASRYRQNLRSYRKKVLNGIKHGGKPHKFLRYQELLRKREPVQSLENKNTLVVDKSFQSEVKNIPEGSTDTVKVGERKRGRPRKIVDPSKVKERRRSDKEVDFIEKNFEREGNDFSPSKRKRKLSSKLQYYKKINVSDEKDDFSSGQVITNKNADSSKKFCCAVCKEIFPEMPEFREHILVHRMEENSYQCMECGECFVVRPSLEKHLHAFHKIKNTDKYIADNGCCNQQKKEAPEPECEPLKENQCKVCKDQFDRPIDLTKHFRIHGMAFLKEFKKDGKTK